MSHPLLEKLNSGKRFLLLAAGECVTENVFLAAGGVWTGISFADFLFYRMFAWDVSANYPFFRAFSDVLRTLFLRFI